MEFNGVKIDWLGHSGFLLKNSKVIAIDPFKVKKSEKADIILISHEHFDHCSPNDIAKFVKDSTVIVCPKGCESKISGNKKIVKANDSIEIDGVKIKVVEAYNTNKPFHPKGLGVGYIVSLQGVSIYHAGDTDLIPEMNSIKSDIALLPVSGTYVMTAEEAVKAAEKIKPKIAIPMHFGAGVAGTKSDAEKFKKLFKGKTEILE